jgi:hypothetical protein
MPRYAIIFISIITICLIFSACEPDKAKQKKADAKEKDAVSVVRFEREFFQIEPGNIVPGLVMLAEKYPDLYPAFINGALGIPNKYNEFSKYESLIRELLTNPYVLGLYDSVQHKYPDLKRVEKDFTLAFRQYHKAFPDNPVPKVYSIISEFGAGAFTVGKETIGIGLDLFLGSEYVYYPAVGVPAFLLPRLDEQFIVPSAMQVLAKELAKEPIDKPTLLAFMLYHGKLLYFTEMMLPKKSEDLIMGYTPEQIAWCKENETNIWGFFIGKELLYNPRMMEFAKYIEDAPFTYGMPEGSPGRVATWTGWQIVRSYMKNNSGVSLAELMAMDDHQQIFNQSGYKPRKK